MNRHRILGDGANFQHCISRTIERRFIFKDDEKRRFRLIMRKLEAFLGVRVVTYCLMSNHFHVLLHIPDPDEMLELSPEILLERLSILYSKKTILDLRQKFDRAGDDAAMIARLMAPFQKRMGKMDVFMKELKQRFSQWYNRKNGRRGSLWEDRYTSVLVEGDENALITMAAYIDLNPVRAKMVEDPKDYPWSGYGEAMAGSKQARDGLGMLLQEALNGELVECEANWRRTGPRYRTILFDHGEERQGDEFTGSGAKAGFSREKVEAVVEAKGELPVSAILRCRVRYFCAGVVFGSADFVNRTFVENRDRIGLHREIGARKMKGRVRWGDLRVMRDLRSDPMES